MASRTESATDRFDVAVVGLGLIGSAALRHLARTDVTAIGIGPGEPGSSTDGLAATDGPYASHYDSGRVTRRLDAEREWAILASRAIAEYPIIEQSSGLRFHRPSGFLFVRNDAEGIANLRAVAAELSIPITVESVDQRRSQFPQLSFPSGFTSFHECGPAGHIDPRILVEAQLIAAQRSGAEVVRKAVRLLDVSHGSNTERGGPRWRIEIEGGRVIIADSVVVATGPYPNDLLPDEVAISVRPEAVILGEVSEATADDLASLPTVIHLLEHDVLDDAYVVPPVRYPNGRIYVKMGGSMRNVGSFATVDEKRIWMTGSAADAQLPMMRAVLTAMLPTTEFLGWSMKPCLISDTPSGLPYVAPMGEGLFVALGGNGHAAKSSDAIGALVAGLVASDGRWTDSELDEAAFGVQFGSFVRRSGSRHGS